MHLICYYIPVQYLLLSQKYRIAYSVLFNIYYKPNLFFSGTALTNLFPTLTLYS